jgi:signal transduction histidine kinase
MVICFKKFYALLFLLLSIGLPAKENNKKSFVAANHVQTKKEKVITDKSDEKGVYKKIHYTLNSPQNNRSGVFSNQIEISLLKNEEQNKIRLFTVIAFLTFLIPFSGFLFQYNKRLKIQRILNTTQTEISSQEIDAILKEQELKLIKELIGAQDRERERISRELHENIIGSLAAVKLQLNHLNNTNLRNISTINFQLNETYQQVRNLSHILVPKKFSQTKFCEVLESYFNNINAASPLQISFLANPKKQINDMNELIQVEVFKIIQELLTNTIKHAKVLQIKIQLDLVENDLNLLFEDDGVGFTTENYSREIGFINLETRINKLNGSFLIDSELKKGGKINIEIPSFIETAETKTKLKTVKGINLKSQLDDLKGKF